MVRGCIFSVERKFETFCNRENGTLVVPGEADGKRIPDGEKEEGAMGPADSFAALGLFGFLAVGAIALFTMISVSSWASARQKEREAYYKSDMLKKIAEAQGPGAASALDLLREEAKIYSVRTKQGLKIGGLVCFATGLGVLTFLKALVTDEPVYLCGLIVLLIGVALYAGSYVVTVPAEPESK
jgi:hypothetical protein